nr:MAG TPA: hypothetical protein [Caudoviricetes sp.]
MSCRSCPRENASALEWTAFPDPFVDGKAVVVYDSLADTVSMPLWYWKQIVSYASDTEMNIEILNGN